MTPRIVATVVMLAGLLATGCSHYRLGTGAAPAFHSLHITPAANRTSLPQAQPAVSIALREAFARDGRTRLAGTPEEADATLSITLSEYRREVAAVRDNDTGLARKFNVTLGATCTLRETRTGRLIWENRPISVQREVFTDSGQLQAEYQALPLLAEALAAKVARAALDTW